MLSTVCNLGYVWVHTEISTLVYTEFYVFDYLYLTEAPPLRLVKYTEKQVLDEIEALEDDLYSEVLTLTRQEKDQQREQEKIQEEKRAQEMAEAKAAEEVKKYRKKKVSKKVQKKDKQKEEEG